MLPYTCEYKGNTNHTITELCVWGGRGINKSPTDIYVPAPLTDLLPLGKVNNNNNNDNNNNNNDNNNNQIWCYIHEISSRHRLQYTNEHNYTYIHSTYCFLSYFHLSVLPFCTDRQTDRRMNNTCIFFNPADPQGIT